MSIFRRFRWRFSLFLVFSLCVLAAVSQGMHGRAAANGGGDPLPDPDSKILSDSVGCWVSGPYMGGEQEAVWGGELDFVVMPEDNLGALDSGDDWSVEKDVATYADIDQDEYTAARVAVELKRRGFSGNPRPAYFFDFPSYIDHAFGINTEGDSVDVGGVAHVNNPDGEPLNDLRYYSLTGALAGEADDDKSFLFIPWMDSKQYFKRRSVARKVVPRVLTHKGTGWVVDSLPGGGFSDDPLAMLEDAVAANANRDRSRTNAAHAGSRFTVVEGQVAANEINGVYDGNCSGTACTMSWNLNSEPTQVEMRGFERDVSDDETFHNTFENTLRYVNTYDEGGAGGVVAIPTRPGDVGDVTMPARRLGGRGYRDWRQEDTGGDSIHVNIVLDDEFRRDFPYKSVSVSGGEPNSLPAFGYYTKTYEGFGDPSELSEVPEDFWRLRPSGRRHEARNILYNREEVNRENDVFDRSTHVGYRQPVLDRFYVDNEDPDTQRNQNSRDNMEHVRWPVHMEDMNWYLYELPGHLTEDPSAVLFYTNEVGFRRVARSGYAVRGLDPAAFPQCENLTPGVFTQGSIHCEFNSADKPVGRLGRAAKLALLAGVGPTGSVVSYDVVDPANFSNEPWLAKESRGLDGNGNLVDLGYFPFDVMQADSIPDVRWGELTLDWRMLSRLGVASASDVDGEGRKLSRFSFEINESSVTGDEISDLEGDSRQQERLGIPKSHEGMKAAVDGMPAKRLDPNRAHLLVITFYESGREVGDFELQGTRYVRVVDGEETASFTLPHRRLRRVICRMLILPAGFSPVMEKNASVFEEVWSKIDGVIGDAVQRVSNWITRGAGSVAKAPFWAAKKAGEVGCAGLEKVDKITALQFSPEEAPETAHAGSGILVANESVRNKRRGLDACFRVAAPVEVDCDPGADIVYRGRCTALSKPRLYIEKGEFLDLEGKNEGVGYKRYETVRIDATPPPDEHADTGVIGSYRGAVIDEGDGVYRAWDKAPGGTWRMKTIKVHDAMFFPVPSDVDRSVQYVEDDNSGLTRLSVKWETDSSVVSDLPLYRSTGMVVIVRPDEKSSPLLEGKGIQFVLPRWVRVTPYYGAGDDEGNYSLQPESARRLPVNGFNVGGLDLGVSNDGDLTSVVSVDTSPLESGGELPTFVHVAAMGAPDLQQHLVAFDDLLNNLPLAPGFRHGFSVATYAGDPDFDLAVGPFSETLYLDGGSAACYALETDGTPVEIRHMYDCAGFGRAGSGVVEDVDDEPFRFGLLALTGTEICTDIFSTTPAGFTWDNRVVRSVWGLMWIIAGGILFTLLMWQGLRMTYDIWIDPQPAVGLREMVPRFLLAVALAAGSLVLCQLVLTVASDLTCFVAQMTGMTMWGVIGTTLGILLNSFLAWEHTMMEMFLAFDFVKLLKVGLLFIVLALVIVIFLIIILGLFVKVALAMLMRIALLAVLVAVSPVAFAFYASDSTSHWTKTWVSMFLGSTFQQVVVLVVIFLGAGVMGVYLRDGVDTGLPTMVVGMILAILTLSMADRVPDIVNPKSKGMSGALGGMAAMGGMVAGAGLMVASAGVGGVAGAAAGAIRGPSSSGSGNAGGGAAGGNPPGGSPAGGGPSSSPGGAAASVSPVSTLGGQTFSGPGSTGAGSAREAGGGEAGESGGVAVTTGPSGGDSGGDSSGGSRGSGSGSGDSGDGGKKEPGRLSRTWSGMTGGARGGARWASGMNRRASDISSGNFVRHHGSGGDDSAGQISRMRREQEDRQNDQQTTFNNMLAELKKMNSGD